MQQFYSWTISFLTRITEFDDIVNQIKDCNYQIERLEIFNDVFNVSGLALKIGWVLHWQASSKSSMLLFHWCWICLFEPATVSVTKDYIMQLLINNLKECLEIYNDVFNVSGLALKIGWVLHQLASSKSSMLQFH
jgi:hypothetical protein